MKKRNLLDLEITVRCIIPSAASRSELKEHYKNDPLVCAKQLADNEQGLCGTINCKRFEIIEARVVEERL